MSDLSPANSSASLQNEWLKKAMDQNHDKRAPGQRTHDGNVLPGDRNASTKQRDISDMRNVQTTEGELEGELRSRLLRMIVSNEQTRKSQSAHNQP